jgi:hypothetical protein
MVYHVSGKHKNCLVDGRNHTWLTAFCISASLIRVCVIYSLAFRIREKKSCLHYICTSPIQSVLVPNFLVKMNRFCVSLAYLQIIDYQLFSINAQGLHTKITTA